MRILVDIDDVIRRLQDSINHVYEEIYPNKWWKPKDKWELDEFYEIGHEINKFAFETHAKIIFGGAQVYQGAGYFLDELIRLGHTVVLCTVQNRHSIGSTVSWLHKNLISYHELYITGLDPEKNGKQITGDVMIDDGLHNLEKFDGLKICFAHPWNEGFTDGFRTNSYDQIIKHIADHQEMLVGKGQKFSKGKRQWNLLPWDTLEGVVDVLTDGAVKYSPDNWKHVPDGRTEYFNALHRHLRKLEAGEFLDKDSGLPGTSHMLCCALFYAWLVEQEQETTNEKN
jgi:5'(3')-deoxyribonucleotidase